MIGEVEKIEPAEDGFHITTAELRTYSSKTVIITTGMTRRKLGIEGEERYQRKGVFYGNIQDLSFVHDKDVAVIGGGNSALQMAENLHGIARHIHLVSATELTADPVIIERVKRSDGVSMYEEYKTVAFTGGDSLSGITIRKMAGKDTISLPVRGVFIAIGFQPNSTLFSHLVAVNDRGEIIIQPDCSTSHPGIFAAGDITNAFGKRIIIASGEGAKAALAARQHLLDLRKKKDVAVRAVGRQGLPPISAAGEKGGEDMKISKVAKQQAITCRCRSSC